MPLEGTAAAAVLAADEVWELERSGHQPSGSFGEILDVLISSRPEGSAYTTARAAYLDRLALLAAGGAGELTPARAALLSNLDAAISSRPAGSDYTAIRAGYLDRLDALVSSRASGADYTAARAALLDFLDAAISSRAAIADYTAARAAKLDNLDAAITSRPAGSDYTAARAAKLDQLDAAITSRPAGSDYTPTRAGKLDYLDAPVSGAGGGCNVLLNSGYPPVMITSTTVADTFGSWTQLYSDVGTGRRLYFVVINTSFAASVTWEIEIGEGAAGSEAAIIRFSGYYFYATAAITILGIVFPIYRALTNNARLSARLRTSGTTARNFYVSALKG